MTLALVLRFLIIVFAMFAAGVTGYVFARNQAERRTALQIAMLSSEISKMRRRTAHAEAQADKARNSLTQEKRRNRRG
jgi:flagellar biosynthesis chaperone FliJ